jgi:hypothetical protein
MIHRLRGNLAVAQTYHDRIIKLFPDRSLDLSLVHRAYLPPIWCSGFNLGYNADGFYTTSGVDPGLSGYVQVFRNGIIESAVGDVRESGRILNASELEYQLAERTANYMTALSNAGISPPMFVFLSGIRMNRTVVAGHRPFATPLPPRKDDLLLPAITLEAFGMKKDYCRALKPIFDAVWNAAGYAASQNYGPDGSWIGRA